MTRLIIAAAAMVLTFMSTPALASHLCVPREIVLDSLARSYEEIVVGQGLMNNGNLLELLVSPDGSFSVLITMPGGKSCMIASGEGWDALVPKPSPEPGEGS